jgi:hypothetical protein
MVGAVIDMSDPIDKLTAHMLLGQVIKEQLDEQQAQFDKSHPTLSSLETEVADVMQGAAQKKFNRMITESECNGTDFAGMERVELRLWAPDKRCALMQVHEYMMTEFGVFNHICISTGLIPLAPCKLYFIAVVIGRADFKKMFKEEPTTNA